MSATSPSARRPAEAAPLIPRRDQAPVRAGTMPLSLTPFVGREREVAAVCTLLQRDDLRILTLTGPGGVGKTRLAGEVAATLDGQSQYADGVAFVALAPISDPTLVVPAIARTLGVREIGDRPLIEGLRALLREKNLLLLLDNAEQVVAGAPALVELLIACPFLTLLVTSRVRLRVQGEQEFAVPPLAVPNVGHRLALSDLARCEAVALFLQHARTIQPDFALTEANAPAVAEICRRLDGLPLAIELAAGWTKVLPPPALLTRLAAMLPLLAGGPRDQPTRLQTIRDAIAWSYDLLDEPEQALFRRLTVFAGGFTVEAAESIAGGADDIGLNTLEGIALLVDQSLLRPVDGGNDEPRFGMLETIREYGLDQLGAAGEGEAARRRHAEWCLAFAERAGPNVFGPDQVAWVARLEAEHANCRTALQWALDRGEAETALRLVGALWLFWNMRGHLMEGRTWAERALAAGESAPPEAREAALVGAAILALDHGDHSRAAAHAEEVLAHGENLGDPASLAWAHDWLAAAAAMEGDDGRALAHQEQALALRREAGDPLWIAYQLMAVAERAHVLGDQGRARALCEEALAIQRPLGDRWTLGQTLDLLVLLDLEEGNLSRAAGLFRERLDAARQLKMPHGIVASLGSGAALAAALGQHASAARLRGATDALLAVYGAVLWPGPAKRVRERMLSAARAHLGEAGLTAALAEGQALPLEQAMAEAQAVADGATEAELGGREPAGHHGLTTREMEVLRLLVSGRSNREIADTLFISVHTATTHVSNVLHKLAVESRAAAIAYAYQHGLV